MNSVPHPVPIQVQDSSTPAAEYPGVRSDQIRVDHVTTEAQFDALKQDWETLCAASSTAGLFNQWNWNRLWWEHYGRNDNLHIIVVRINDQVKAIAPMYRCRSVLFRMFNVNTLRFIGTGGDTSPDDLDILCAEDVKELVVALIADDILQDQHSRRIQLSDMANDSLLARAVNAKSIEYRWNASVHRVQNRLVDTLPVTVDAFEKSISRNARKQRKRRRRQLYAAGNIQFGFCRTPDEVNQAFDALLHLHTLRHATKGNAGSFQSSDYCRFHLALMLSALECNQLRLLVLSVDGKTIGVEYAFLCNNVVSFFQTGFDPGFQHLSPGHVLMMHMIDSAINEGATHIDLLKGDYPYKTTYAKQTRTTVDLELWRSGTIHTIKGLTRRISAWRAEQHHR